MTVSLVTGAGSGIGAATAAALSTRGDVVICIDVDEDSARRTAAGLGQAEAVALDVTAPAHELTLDNFERVLGVNLTGMFLTCRAAARAMMAGGHGGKLVLIGSVNSSVVLPGPTRRSASRCWPGFPCADRQRRPRSPGGHVPYLGRGRLYDRRLRSRRRRLAGERLAPMPLR